MARYLPPSGRMRKLKQTRTVNRVDVSVPVGEQASPDETKEEPVAHARVGAMNVTIRPGPDHEFGTPDDEVDITPVNAEPEGEYGEFYEDDIPSKSKLRKMLKEDVFQLALDLGRDVVVTNTEAEMIDAILNV